MTSNLYSKGRIFVETIDFSIKKDCVEIILLENNFKILAYICVNTLKLISNNKKFHFEYSVKHYTEHFIHINSV